MFSSLKKKPFFKPIILSIEGNIGSGKSTIIKYLKSLEFKDFAIKNLNVENVVFIPEPVDEWNNITDKDGETILSKFYKNTSKYSFAFQMMAYITRLSKTIEIIQNNPNCIFITERALNTDKFVFCKMLYDSGFIDEIEYKIYNKWFDEFNSIPISNYIYIKSDPDICYTRVLQRNRTGEESINKEYLHNCNNYHEKWLSKLDNVVSFDGNLDKNSDIYKKSITDEIIKYIQKLAKNL